jgi:RNA polymerase sigma factor (sigma-70 family)
MSAPDAPPSALGRLLAGHRPGDPAARNAVLAHCHDRFKTLTGRMLAKYPAVRDRFRDTEVYHEVWVRMAKALDARTFDDPLHFLKYAARVVRNHLAELARKRWPALLPRAGSDGSATNPIGARPAPAEDPHDLAVWGEFHAGVDALPPDQQELFDLLYYQELSQYEAADLLGLPRTTLRTRWNDAKLDLMRRLDHQPPFPG